MTPEHQFPLSPRMHAAIEEMKSLISSRYPTTTYTVYEWDDPEGIFLSAVVDTEDLEAVTDLFRDRELDLQIQEDLPLFVVPERTPEKHAALLAREAAEREASLVG
jgi:hypothetical protein